MSHHQQNHEPREMQATAPHFGHSHDPRGPGAADPQPPVASDAAAVTADVLMHFREIAEVSQRSNSVNRSEKEYGKQQATSSDHQQQPTRVVKLITASSTGKASNGNGAATNGSSPDASLPPGWQRVTHDSGLPCFVNRELQIVTWSKPYVLDAIGGDFLTMATTHVPPLSLFNRRGLGSAASSLTAQLAMQRQPAEEPAPEQSRPPARPNQALRKRKAAELTASSEFELPTIQVIRQGDGLPLLEINGKRVPSPEGKTIHHVLKEFCEAAWGRVPQYNYTRAGADMNHPTGCAVRIGRHQYHKQNQPTKFLAKDAAAQHVLDHHAPGFWDEWTKSGRVDTQVHEQQEAMLVRRQLKRLELQQAALQRKCDQSSPEPKRHVPAQPEPSQTVNPQGVSEPMQRVIAQAPERTGHQVLSLEQQVEHQIREVMEQEEASRNGQYQQSAPQTLALYQSMHPVHHAQSVQQPRQQHLPLPLAQSQEQPLKRNAPPSRQAASPQMKLEPQLPTTSGGSMTLEEFKTLSVDDLRVLQACLDLSIKTPAQVIQEYQNRHRGISVNYNTLPHQKGGEKVFKTIVTAGSTAAEGIGSSKKVSKQVAAQFLLKVLHERTATLYHEIAELYSRSHHNGNQMTHTASTSSRSSPSKKARRSPPVSSLAVAMPYAPSGQAYSQSGAAGGWDGYAAYNDGSNEGWQGSPQEAGYGRKNKRIVEYSGPPSGLSGGYAGYYGNDPSGSRGAAHPHTWNYNQLMPPPPPPQQQQYGVYGPGSYAAAPPRPSDQYHAHPPPPPNQSTLPPGYSYGPPPPRDAMYNRPKGPYR